MPSTISKFVFNVFRYNTNNIAGYTPHNNVTIGQCSPHSRCCVKELER